MLSLPTGLFTGVQLDERCAHKWENPEINQIQTQKQAKQNDWSKETWKKCPIKVVQTTTRVRLSDSLSLSESVHVSIHMNYTLFLLINTCFNTFHLWGSSFLQSWRTTALSLTTSLAARIWCFHHCGLTSVSGQEPKPCFKSLQAEATWDQLDTITPCLGSLSCITTCLPSSPQNVTGLKI